MNKVTVSEAKRYLGLDGEEQDKLLASFLTCSRAYGGKGVKKADNRRHT